MIRERREDKRRNGLDLGVEKKAACRGSLRVRLLYKEPGMGWILFQALWRSVAHISHL